MRDNLIHTNSLNEKLDFYSIGVLVNENELRDYEWSVLTENDSIVGFTKGVVEKTIPLIFYCNEKEANEIKNKFYEHFEIDVLTKKYGYFEINGYKLYCFLTKSVKSNYNKRKRYLELNISITTDRSYWIKETTKTINFNGAIEVSGDDENKTYNLTRKEGTINVSSSGLESIDIDTGLNTVDGILILNASGSTGTTFGWIYTDSYKGYIYKSYTGIEQIAYNKVSIADGKVTCNQRNSSYPIGTGTYKWIAWGSGSQSGSIVKESYQVEIEEDTDSITINTDFTNIDGVIIYRFNSLVDNTHGFVYSNYVDGTMYFIKGSSLSYNRFSTEGHLSTDRGKITTEQVNSSYPIKSGKYSIVIYGTGNFNNTSEAENTLKYPFTYSYVYRNLNSINLNNDNFIESEAIIRIYGNAVDPIVKINDNVYQVYETLTDNEYLEINTKEKTIYKYSSYGDKTNIFNSRNKEYDVFKPIPSGQINISVNTECKVDIVLIEQRGEPKWE